MIRTRFDKTPTTASRSIAPLASVLFVVLLSARPSLAILDGPYSMEVLVGGRPLQELSARGRTYVEACEGQEYAVRLSNRTGERIGIALSVDGLNSIDAKTTAARDARKWILDPYETITIGGWQTGSGTARRFFFTTEDRSYGAWLGRTSNLGVVSAAVFQERHPRIASPLRPTPSRERSAGEAHGAPVPLGGPEAAPSAAPSPSGADRAARDRAKAVRGRSDLSDELAATGIGREVEHRVVQVAFDAEDAPATVLELRYEYRDALVRLGVLPRWGQAGEDPLARREGARGFEEPGFAPDPFRPR